MDRAIVWTLNRHTTTGGTLDIERSFLSKVVLSGQIDRIIAEGINESHFEEEIHKDIFHFAAEHMKKYKGPPSLDVLRDKFYNYNFETPTDSLEYLTDKFKSLVKRNCAHRSLMSLAELLDTEHVENIDGLFLEEARRLSQVIPVTSLSRFSDIDSRIQAYETKQDVNRGIKMGIPEFDRLTLGIQPHELVSIVGWQGTGKSTLTQWILFNAWMQGKTAMIIPLEMDAPALMRKWDTMLTNFDYRSLKAHELSVEELERWRVKAQKVRDKECDIIVRDDVRSCTPDVVFAEAMRYKPDIIAVDYISLMDTSRSAGSQMWEKVTYLTQSLKQIARTTGIPILAVAQTNINSADGGAQLSNISYSRSVGQDSDIVLGLHQDEEMKENQQMTVRMLKNRDGAASAADLYWNMDSMEFRPWREVEYFKNQQKRRETIVVDGKTVDEKTGEIVE